MLLCLFYGLLRNGPWYVKLWQGTYELHGICVVSVSLWYLFLTLMLVFLMAQAVDYGVHKLWEYNNVGVWNLTP